MCIGQSGDEHLPTSSNGDGMIYLAQGGDFVLYTNAAQQAVFNNTAITFK